MVLGTIGWSSPYAYGVLQGFNQVQITALKAAIEVILPGSDGRDHCDFPVPFLSGNLPGKLQQLGPLPRVLGSACLFLPNLEGLPVNMYLPDDSSTFKVCDPGVWRIRRGQG